MNDLPMLSAYVGSDQETIRFLLNMYFRLDEQGFWRNKRCDKTIEKFEDELEKRRKAGIASAESKKNKLKTLVGQVNNSSSTHVEHMLNRRSADDEHVFNTSSAGVQLTNNQEPITKKEIDSVLSQSEEFSEFWKAWPSNERKVDKKGCYKIWVKQRLDEKYEQIIAHLEKIKDSKSWKDGFYPLPATYLNQERWNIEEEDPRQEAFRRAI
jgi:uncharacterized protein YdaU (DUF1376 family)